MKAELKAAFAAEMARAGAAEASGDLDEAFRRLERAHVLGQRYVITHLHTHLRMLRIARRRRDVKETRGQVMRLFAVVPGYLFGWTPKGNTGGADVSAIKPMRPPEDLAPLLRDYHVWRDVAGRVLGWGLAIVALMTAPLG